MAEVVVLPEESLRSVITPLHSGECSNKTFRNIISIIEHLSHLPGARDVFLAHLASSCDALAATTCADLDALLACTDATQDEVEVQKVTLALFTPADSTQAKLLRVLKTIDYIHSKRKHPSHPPSTSKSAAANRNLELEREIFGLSPRRMQSPSPSDDASEHAELEVTDKQQPIDDVLTLFRKPVFGEIWRRLNAALNFVQNHANMIFVATVLLPLIDCLMVGCKYLMMAKDDHHTGSTMQLHSLAVHNAELMRDPKAPLPTSGEDLFFAFTERHRKILNTLVRNNPKLLRGSFSLLIHNPKVLEFDNKRNYFNQQLHKKPADSRYGLLHVNVRRQYIFQDSYYQLQNHTGDEIKYSKLSVRFHGEEGADYGGVSREWYQELTKEMFNPNYALFTPSAEKMGVTYQPNPSSWVNPSHMLYFKFVGRIIGKAIYDGRLLECYFTRSVYKHILGKSVDVSDMEAIDPDFYKSLTWILENDITDVLDLTFSTEMDEFGEQKIIDLKPNGRNIPVTDQTKHEYVKYVVENRLTTAIKDQLQAFLNGFYDIVPLELVRIFNEKELELLISGVPDIDIDDWKNNTEYRGYTASSAQVQWFWRVVRSFDQEERAKLLQFATGTSKVPLEGFAKLQGSGGLQKFQIHKDFGSTNRLPCAHTCFNQIDIPVYDSYEQLRERFYVAITEAATGFGFE